jgi:nitroimidazol reductase NimA-like FMN-containing flavoprotein (pyridoxamine 5'-phosphate oxidase superfamily)
MSEKLSETQIDNILLSQSVGRLGCTDGKRPYIIPVTYIYDGKNIICQTTEGMKLDILRKNPNVCFEVDIIHNIRHGESVVITGKFHELTGELSVAAREYLFDHVWPLSTGSVVHSHEHDVVAEVDNSGLIKPIMYKIEIIEKTGRLIN